MHSLAKKKKKTLDNAKTSELNLGQYQKQAALVEDKIKQITTQVKWINTEKLAEKANMNEISLQRDIAISERDQLREQLIELQKRWRTSRGGSGDFGTGSQNLGKGNRQDQKRGKGD